MAELVDKVNVKARVQQASHRTVEQARQWIRTHRRPLIAASSGVAVAVTTLLIVLTRRQ